MALTKPRLQQYTLRAGLPTGIEDMAKETKAKVFITQPVAVGGVHYPADDKKLVTLDESDANFLLVRGKAKRPAKKSED